MLNIGFRWGGGVVLKVVVTWCIIIDSCELFSLSLSSLIPTESYKKATLLVRSDIRVIDYFDWMLNELKILSENQKYNSLELEIRLLCK